MQVSERMRRVDCEVSLVAGEIDELPGLIFTLSFIAYSGTARSNPNVAVVVTRESVIKAATFMQNMGVARLSRLGHFNTENSGRCGDYQLVLSACLGLT